MKTCPCCGQPLIGEVEEAISRLPLSQYQRRIALRLAKQFGQWVDRAALIEAVYWDDYDGGPDNPGNIISVLVHGMRPRLGLSGLTIEGGRGRNAGRRLVWAENKQAAA